MLEEGREGEGGREGCRVEEGGREGCRVDEKGEKERKDGREEEKKGGREGVREEGREEGRVGGRKGGGREVESKWEREEGRLVAEKVVFFKPGAKHSPRSLSDPATHPSRTSGEHCSSHYIAAATPGWAWPGCHGNTCACGGP